MDKMNKFKYLIFVAVIITACKEQKSTVLTGSFDQDINDSLIVMNILQSPSNMDTLYISDGSFEYTVQTEHPEIRSASNADQSIVFSFLTYPGNYNVSFNNNQLSIDGELNGKLNEYHKTTMGLMMQRMSLLAQGKSDTSQVLAELDANIRSHLIEVAQTNVGTPLVNLSVLAASTILKDDADLFKTLYDYTDKENIDKTELGKYVQSIHKRYSEPDILPDAVYKDVQLDTTQFKITTDYAYVDFWASWCRPCRQKIPYLKNTYEEYKNSMSIEFISVSIDEDSESWLTAVFDEDMAWQQLIVSNKTNYEAISSHWGIISIPHGVFIDREGRTLANYVTNSRQLQELLEKYKQ